MILWNNSELVPERCITDSGTFRNHFLNIAEYAREVCKFGRSFIKRTVKPAQRRFVGRARPRAWRSERSRPRLADVSRRLPKLSEAGLRLRRGEGRAARRHRERLHVRLPLRRHLEELHAAPFRAVNVYFEWRTVGSFM